MFRTTARHSFGATAAVILSASVAALAQTEGQGERQSQVTTGLAGSFESAPTWLRDVYADQGYEAVWSKGKRPSRAFKDLVRAIENAEKRGLDTSLYALDRVKSLRREDPAVREQGAALIFARFAQDLIEGRTDPLLEYQPDFAQVRDAGKAEILTAAYAQGNPVDYLASATPDNFLVERLTDALGQYRRIAERGGWDAITNQDDILIKEGEDHPLVPAIRARLKAEGFARRAGKGEVWSSTDATALKAFQRTRSMSDDGVIGPNTIDALNETPEDLIETLEINIERARWLPRELGDRAAFVNVADYTLRVYEEGAKSFDMPVIVGEKQTQTPIFADTMESVVVNPYWNVPASILIGEIAPKQLDDPTYIERKNFEVLMGGEVVAPRSVDWQAASEGSPTFRVRQTAGDYNALGRIKFLFPNKYAVYLHDTPADSLFSQDIRTFSHGCIRIAEPVKFGAWLLGEDQDTLQRMIDSRDRTEMPTPATPVYITYFTAWAEPDGQVTFARDIYDRDARVGEALIATASGD